MKGRKYILCFIFFASLSVVAQAKVWSLEECINYAQNNSISLQKQLLHREAQQVDLQTAKGSLFPNLSASGSQNFSFGRGLNADNTYVNSNTTNTSFSVGGAVTLFQGLRGWNNIVLQKLNLEAITADVAKAREDLTISVMQKYVEVLYCKELLQIANNRVEIDSCQLRRIEILEEGGRVKPEDVLLQKTSYSQSSAVVIESLNALKLAKLNLVNLMNLELSIVDIDAFDIKSLENDIIVLWHLTPEEIYAIAKQHRPQLKAEQFRAQLAKKQIAYSRGAYSPSLLLSGGIGTNYYTTSGISAPNFQEQLRNNFSQYVGLTLSIPIFTGLTTVNNEKKARIAYKEQLLVVDEIEKALFEEINETYINFQSCCAKVQACEETVGFAEETVSVLQDLYEAGKITITELNEAKNNLSNAQAELSKARCECQYLSRLLALYEK